MAQTMSELATEFKSEIQKVGHAVEEFKATHAQSKKESDVLFEEKMKKIVDDITTKHEAYQKEQDRITARLADPAFGVPTNEKEAVQRMKNAELFRKMRVEARRGFENTSNFVADIELAERYEKAFNRYMRVGEAMSGPDVMKDMSVGSDPDGGYFVAPPTIAQSVLQRIFETSPMRQICSVMNIGTAQWIQPEDPSDIGAGWVTERQTRPTTTTTQPSRKTITAQEEYAEPQVTQTLLEDSMIDLEAYIPSKIADKLARLENTAFVGGTGSGQPRGFLTYAAGTADSSGTNNWGEIQQIKTGSSGAFTYGNGTTQPGLIGLVTSIKDAYQQNACFLTQRQSVAGIMTLTDTNGRYIFQPLLNGAFNNTPLLGYPLRYATDMPAIAAGALALAFGDFGRGYQIVDRVGLSMIRDNLTAKPNVLFYTRKRVGGDVVDYDAIKLQLLS